MDRILTVTLNPALDLAASVPAVTPGPKLRCSAPVFDPGGGGINVSRAIRNLGGSSTAFAILGGPAGEQILALLQAEGIAAEAHWTGGATRLSVVITDAGTAEQYRFILPGPALSRQDADAALERICALADGGIAVLSGSQPPGLPAGFPFRLAAELAGRGARLFADTSGPALEALLAGGQNPPDLLRLDMLEAQKAAGSPLETAQDSAAFAANLVRRGVAGIIVLGRGAGGSVLAAPGARLFCAPPQVPVKSKTGAGDSFMAALSLCLARGGSLRDALRKGVAAASAAVMTEATALCGGADAQRLEAQCQVEDI